MLIISEQNHNHTLFWKAQNFSIEKLQLKLVAAANYRFQTNIQKLGTTEQTH